MLSLISTRAGRGKSLIVQNFEQLHHGINASSGIKLKCYAIGIRGRHWYDQVRQRS
jgi:hypothetical protein